MVSQAEVNLELRVEYALGILIFIARYLGRIFVVGRRGLGLDDVFTGVAALVWTADFVILDRIGIHGSSVGQTPESAALLDDATVESFRVGDKLTVGSWFCYISLIWSMKAVLLFYYSRMTFNTWQNTLLIYVGCYTALTFVTALLIQFTLCVPFDHAWQVRPYPGDHCVFRTPNYIAYPTLSITSDIGIIAIPMPLLWKTRLPPLKKFVLGILFAGGVFIIAATLLRTVYSLRSIEDLGIATQWASREYFVTALVISAPAIYPLFSRRLWGMRTSGNRSGASHSGGRSAQLSGKFGNSASVTRPSRADSGNDDDPERGRGFELSSKQKLWSRGNDAKVRLPSRSSEERIINNKDTWLNTGSDEEGGIQVVREVHVTRESEGGGKGRA